VALIVFQTYDIRRRWKKMNARKYLAVWGVNMEHGTRSTYLLFIQTAAEYHLYLWPCG
jgi:hypothetical protein